jgi:hypothetical protein
MEVLRTGCPLIDEAGLHSTFLSVWIIPEAISVTSRVLEVEISFSPMGGRK